MLRPATHSLVRGLRGALSAARIPPHSITGASRSLSGGGRDVMGLMQHFDLTVSSLMDHGVQTYPDQEIVSRTIEDPSKFHRYTFKDCAARSKQVANALAKLGVERGDAVGTIAWNGYRHLELYYGVSGAGGILHTINPRLHPQQMVYVLKHAEDKVLFVDLTFYAGASKLLEHAKGLKYLVVMTDKANMPADAPANVLCYEDLISAESTDYSWPKMSESHAAAICYTSGTTGNPKGVLYSHRSTVLHAMGMCSANSFNIGTKDAVLPIVPMFHVNAWGIPYCAFMSGCKLVFPGSAMDGKSLYEAFRDEKVTASAGVPTIYGMLLQHMASEKLALPDLDRVIVGGAACSPQMIKDFESLGVRAMHAWGMTEMSPTGVVNVLSERHEDLSESEKLAEKAKQGRQMYGVLLKVVDHDGKTIPRDGETSGNLLAKGPWVCESYFKSDKSAIDEDGWFDTGDVATISENGYLHITDRAKDMIKSGGEWISSIDIENIAMGHKGLAMAAVIGVPHPKWDERPLLLCVKKPGQEVTKEELLSMIAKDVHKMCVPDDVVFLDELPIGGTGKILKMKLREQFKDHPLP